MFPLPVQSGTQMRTLQLLQRMARRFDVTFLTVASDAGYENHLAELGRHCGKLLAVVPDNKRSQWHRAAYKLAFWYHRLVSADSRDRFYNTMPSVNRAIHSELATGTYDVLFCEYWFWDRQVFDFRGFKVIDANDVQAMRVDNLLRRSRQPLDRLMRRRIVEHHKHMEAATLARADLVVATTNRDRSLFAAMLPPHVETITIPTGLDTDYFVPQPGIEPETDNVVFYGSLSNPMNRDATRFLVHDILPRLRRLVPGVRLTLLGAFPQPEHEEMARSDPGIRLTGYCEDVRGELSRAAVVVCPLRYGYGVRGRIYELLSMNIPVVATPIAVEGMDLTDGEGLVLAEGAESFARTVAELLRDSARRTALAQRGREVAVKRMSVAATYDALVEHIERRLERPPSATAP